MEKHTTLQPETTLQHGKYRIERILGQGGFGITYLAYQTIFQDNVVIKEFFLNGFCMRSEDNSIHSVNLPTGEFSKYKDRFLQEARFLYKLKGNKNIAEVVDFFEENGTAYMVMPFIADEDIEKYTRKQPNNRLPEEEAVNYMAQIAHALSIVHANHILHRDIKPSNLLRKKDGTVVLIDFGSARELLSGEFSQTMSTIISAGYAPPEQYNASAKRGPFSDIYSMGGTLYRLLTGKLPLDATSRSIEDIPEPITINANISANVNYAIMKAMQLKPANRYQNVEEFIVDLQKVPVEEGKTEIIPLNPPTEIIANRPIVPPVVEPQTEISATPIIPPQKTSPNQPTYQPKEAWHQKTPVRIALIMGLIAILGFSTYKVLNKYEFTPNDTLNSVVETDTVPEKGDNNVDKQKQDSINAANIAANEKRIKDSTLAASSQLSETEKLKSFKEMKQKGDLLFNQKKYEQAKQAYISALSFYPTDSYCLSRIKACNQAIAESQITTPTENPNYNPPPRPMKTYGTIYGLTDATGEPFDYEGDIVANVPHGIGTFKYKSGNTCKGKVVNGHLNGECQCEYPKDNARFVGNAVNDVCTGYGVYYFGDGGRYEGYFANDAFNGPGKVYLKNSKEWFEGDFKNGNVVGTIVWHYADGSTQKGHLEGNTFIPDKSGAPKSQSSGQIKTHHKL